MASITQTTNTLTSAAWAGDFMSREHLLPGGAKVDPAGFTADAAGIKNIPNGTLVGRTYAERDAGTAFGPAADADDEVLIVAFDVTDAAKNSDVELYRFGSIVKENFLPQWGSMSTALKAKIRAVYQTTKGVA
jgi:hypothetical protein